MIPKIILQTSKHSYPEYVSNMWKKRLDDSWIIDWYNDEKIYEFFKSNPHKDFPNISLVFDTFVNGAHKADLFRYYYLYLNGGIFVDSDAMINNNFLSLLDLSDHDHLFVISTLEQNKALNRNTDISIYNGIIGCAPNSDLMYKLLYMVYKTKPKTLDRYYHYICKMTYNMVSKNNPKNTLYLYEKIRDSESLNIVNEHNQLVCVHFWKNKLITEVQTD